VNSLVVSSNGDLIAGGAFLSPGNHVARWDGAAWSPLGGGIPAPAVGPFGPTVCITEASNGDLIGSATVSSGPEGPLFTVHRWSAGTWTQIAASSFGTVGALAPLPNGDVVAVGNFTSINAVSANGVARWNGTSWSAVGSGISALFPLVAAVLPNEELVVGGLFSSAGGTVANGVVRLGTTCPPSVSNHGVGCNGNTLTALSMPYADATFRARGTGLPPLCLIVAATSSTPFAQGLLPIWALLPDGAPGCDLLVQPDFLDLLVSNTGTAEATLNLPNTPPLVGVTLYQQMIPFAIDAQGNWGAITATNALQFTVGDF
jgi:hypothetical protein